MAPQAGLEPATLRLTAGCSAIELLRNTGGRGRRTGRARTVGTDCQYYDKTAEVGNCRTAGERLSARQVGERERAVDHLPVAAECRQGSSIELQRGGAG